MNYHLAKDLGAVLRTAGLASVLEDRVSYVAPNGNAVTDLLIVARLT
jgi:hypothetical protein